MIKLSKDYNLAVKFPKIASEWDYEKNAPLTPYDVTPKSGQKVHWKCKECGYERALSPCRKIQRKYKCKVCSGLILAVKYSKITSEWHQTKNGKLTPKDVHPGSNKKVWWKCKKGHEWQALISYRTHNGSNCGVCAGRIVSKENNLAVKFPAIAAEWDYEKNAPLTPYDVVPGSNKKVWWKCKNGHEWQTFVSSRTRTGSGCKVCLERCVTKENNLAVKFPEIASEWDYEKNAPLTPFDVAPATRKKAWFKCPSCSKSCSVAIANKTILNHKCIFCTHQKVTIKTSLQTKKKIKATNWDQKRNGTITPKDVFPHTKKMAWFKCHKGHHRYMPIVSQVKHENCYICYEQIHPHYKKTLIYKRPFIAGEWHKTMNGDLTPHLVAEKSNFKIIWECPNGHAYQMTIKKRINGKGCPLCKNKKQN